MNPLRALRRRLLLRVYLHGVSMIALAALSAFLVGNYVIKPAVEVPARPSTAWIAWHLQSIATDRAALGRELSNLKKTARIEMSLFEANGQLIASNADEVPPALSAAQVSALAKAPTHFADGSGVTAALDASGQVASYARIKYPMPEVSLNVAMAQLLAALLVLALVSMPLARSITSPIEKLAKLTRAFGEGNQLARAKSERRDEIGDLAQAFDEMADRIVLMRRSEKELLANVSHELRTPLARIRLALELLRDGDTTRANRYLLDIEEDLAELEQLLDDVMTAARFDLSQGASAGAVAPLRRKRIAGAELVQAAQLRFAKRFPERELRCFLSPNLPEVYADPNLLRRVLDNLLENAAKFSDPGRAIELSASAHAPPGRGVLSVQVKDYGIGIDADELERIFEPFYRSDRSRNRSTGGVGLGLALARRIAETHGGRVSARSHEGETTFELLVPAAAPFSSIAAAPAA